uniref:Uncharacterized protein n=1 Tax=Anguilla anguilla TaxID=7936 RepID=A0A0E9PTZ8_ANGAN
MCPSRIYHSSNMLYNFIFMPITVRFTSVPNLLISPP